MKQNIHPNYQEISVNCSCGYTFKTKSTLCKTILSIDICSQCHPFYTGKQRVVDTAGRVERFNKRFSSIKNKKYINF